MDPKLAQVNKWRLRTGERWSSDEDGWNGAFIVPLEGLMWQVICSDGAGWKHVSITAAEVKRLPPWAIMCRVRDLFFADDAWVVQFHPPRDEYVNDHPYVLHLWQSLAAPQPHPEFWMV